MVLSLLAASCLCGQTPTDLFHKAPPAVDEALRARISTFYQFHVDGKFRQAEALVAEESKDFFYSSNKPKYLGFEIKAIEYSDDFTKAKATVITQRIVMMPGFADKPMPVPEPSRWKLVSGDWYWYVTDDDLYQTPFGRLKPSAGTGGQVVPPVIPSEQEMMKVIAEVKADKKEVVLEAGKESSGEFLIANTLAGTVNLTLDAPHGPGFEARLDESVLPPGGQAKVTVKWEPGLRAAPKWLQMVVRVQPTNREIRLRVKFSGDSGDLAGDIHPQSAAMPEPRTVTPTFKPMETALSVANLTPNSGTGATQTFTAIFTDANGYNDLGEAHMLFAVAPDGGDQLTCLVRYDVRINSLWLYSDTAAAFIGPVAPGTVSNALQGSLCAVNTQASRVTGTGNALTVNLNVTFKSTVARNVYMRAKNDTGDTGWLQRGTWNLTAAAIGTMSVSPSSGSGSTQTFTLTYPDPPGLGGAAWGWVEFLVGAASDGGGEPFCFIHYDRAGNGLSMYSGDLGSFLEPVAPGTASTALGTSACSLNTAEATVTNASGNLVVTLPITMKAPMSGAKKTFQRTLDLLKRDTGWQQTGSWTVQ